MSVVKINRIKHPLSSEDIKPNKAEAKYSAIDRKKVEIKFNLDKFSP